jgi:hypothetical protein
MARSWHADAAVAMASRIGRADHDAPGGGPDDRRVDWGYWSASSSSLLLTKTCAARSFSDRRTGVQAAAAATGVRPDAHEDRDGAREIELDDRPGRRVLSVMISVSGSRAG